MTLNCSKQSKKGIASFFISLILAFVFSAAHGQTAQKGTVTLFNSGKQPLPGTEILAFGAPATDTDSNGAFALTLPKANPGQALILSGVYKKGYEVVNDEIMYSWILSEKRPMNIVMAPEGYINESKEKLYSISMKHETVRYQQKIDELNALFQQNKLTEEAREQSIAELGKEISQRRDALKKYAEMFARINPDEIDEIEKKVLQQVAEGDMEAAIETYRNSQLLQKAIKQLEISAKETEDIQSLIPVLYRYANTCMLQGGKDNIQNAFEIHKKIAEDNPKNFEYAIQYTNLLFDLSHKDMDQWIDNCIRIASNDAQLAQAFFLKNSICMIQNRTDEASTLLETLLNLLNEPGSQVPFNLSYSYLYTINDLYAQLFSRGGSNRDAIQMTLEQIEEVQEDNLLPEEIKMKYLQNLYNSLSNYYARNNQYDQAKKSLRKSIELCMQFEKDEDAIADAQYDYYTTMAIYYLQEENVQQALECSEKAAPLGEQLLKKHPNKGYEYLQHHVIAGGIAQLNGDWERSEKEYLKAIGLLEQNDQAHSLVMLKGRLSLATILSDLYIVKNDIEEAKVWSDKASKLADELETIDPISNASELIMAFFNRASLAYQQSNWTEAKYYYQRILIFYEIQPDNPTLSRQTYISTLTNLGAIHMLEKENKEALRLLKKSQKEIRKQMKEEPESATLLFSYANNINNQGNIAMENKNSKEAVKLFSEAEGIYRQLLPSNEPLLTYYLISAELNLSTAYYMEKNLTQAEEYVESVLQKATLMAESYPALYEPFKAVARLSKGVFYTKTNRTDIGKDLVAQALKELENYLEDPLVTVILDSYRNDAIYESK